jgi:hypothetical protein
MGYDVVHADELPPRAVGREHDESDSGQAEVNIVVRGSEVYEPRGPFWL